MFLDEFSTGMDPILKRSVMERLRQEARKGRTIVLTTQIISEAEELCDEILIVNAGKQIARGDLNALKLLSAGVYELSLTFERLPEGLEAELARGSRSLAVSGNTVEVALKEQETDVLALVNELAKRGRVLRVEVSGASLKDIFVELTQRPGSKRDRSDETAASPSYTRGKNPRDEPDVHLLGRLLSPRLSHGVRRRDAARDGLHCPGNQRRL
jgi:ABC-type multidrug transport system ATPase subunit